MKHEPPGIVLTQGQIFGLGDTLAIWQQFGRQECDVFTFFVYNAPQITVAGDLVMLLQQEIASVFVGQFRCGLQHFFREEKPFPVKGTDLNIITRWRYNMCRNARENCQNLRKLVQSLCAPLRPFRSKMEKKFYHSLLHGVKGCGRTFFCSTATN